MEIMLRQSRRIVFCISLLALSAWLVSSSALFAQDPIDPGPTPEKSVEQTGGMVARDVKNNEDIYIIRGDLEAIKVYALTRISVTNPEIADIANVDSNQVLMLAKKSGRTTLIIWDEYGKRSILIHVFEEDLDLVYRRLSQMLETLRIEGVSLEINKTEGKVVATGRIPPEKKAEFEKALDPYSASVLNLVKTSPVDDLIQIDIQIAELNQTLSKSIGIEWNSAVTYAERNFVANAARDIFKVGPLSRTTQIIATVNALITEGKGRILSKPKLVVINGKEASFQVGGEIPISTTTTTSGGNVQQNIEFKEYGITLTVKPTIRDGKVDVILTVEVSDIDEANAVGQNVAFTTRNAQTQILLDNGQTVVIAGLIKQQGGEEIRKVPFLGDIPIVGMVFRKRRTPTLNQDTELVISLTPTIIPQRESTRSVAKKVVETPTEAGPGKPELMEISQGSTETPAESTGTSGTVKENTDAPSASVGETPPKMEPSVQAPAPSAQVTQPSTAMTEPAPEKTAPVANENAPALGKIQEPSPEGEKASEVAAVSEEATKVPAEMAPYIQSIQKKISESVAYPYEAKEKGWEGTVKLALHILRDGTLADVTVKESSGYEIFDNDALNTAQILAPYAAFPTGMKLEELIVTIPIVYSQKAALQEGVCEPSVQVDDNAAARVFLPGGMAYSEMIQKRLAESIVYPEEARENGWEGTVKLTLQILRDGTLAYASVKESSGYQLFDECALKTAKSLAPYSEFPTESELQEVNLTVPIVYSLKHN